MKKFTYQCFETIKVVDGEALHVDYHQMRYEKTMDALFPKHPKDILYNYIDMRQSGTYRVRIDYASKILQVETKLYKPREIKNFFVVEALVKYQYKYSNRRALEELLIDKEKADVIIMQDGFLMDTTIANIALYIDKQWHTPRKPLLEGTTRQRLLDEGFLIKSDLTLDSIDKAENFATMNALTGFLPIPNAQIKK